MFVRAKKANPDVSKWNTSKVVDIENMFFSSNVVELDLSNWNMSKITENENVFKDTSKLEFLSFKKLPKEQDVDLGTLLLAEDLGGDGGLRQIGGGGGHRVAVHQHEGDEVDLVTDLAGEPVHNHDVADGDLLLTAAGLDDRVDHLNAHLCRFFGQLRRLRQGPPHWLPPGRGAKRTDRQL